MPTYFLFTREPLVPVACAPFPITVIMGLATADVGCVDVHRQLVGALEDGITAEPVAYMRGNGTFFAFRMTRRMHGRHGT